MTSFGGNDHCDVTSSTSFESNDPSSEEPHSSLRGHFRHALQRDKDLRVEGKSADGDEEELYKDRPDDDTDVAISNISLSLTGHIETRGPHASSRPNDRITDLPNCESGALLSKLA